MPIYLPVAGMALDGLMLLSMGLSVGLLSGMFGIGGGFVITPLLIFLGVPPLIAVGTGVSQVVAVSVSAALSQWRGKTVDVPMGLLLLAGGIIGATTGVALQRLLKAAGQIDVFISLSYVLVLGVIGTLMFIESLSTLRKRRGLPQASARRGGQHTWIQGLPLKRRFRTSKLYVSTIPPVVIGIFVGWLTALIGVGGGFVVIPALIYLMRVPTRVAIGTSVFQVVFLAGYATLLHATLNFSVDLLLALPLMIGGVVGAQYGIRIGQRLNAEQLRILLALLVLAVGVRMAVDLTLRPEELFVLDTWP
ncbi:MAG: sulfite exporter TauE/SafE family protein [Hyphomicrobiaceae bacterium]|nr:sulfite exporter TauE/SafE family protein [Hyphomicrobiaceae bacterium]